MRAMKLKTKIQISFFAVIAVLMLSTAILGYYFVETQIIRKAQTEVTDMLGAARFFYSTEIDNIGRILRLVSPEQNITELKEKIGLDYLYLVDAENKESVNSEIVHHAFEGQSVGGTRVIPHEELEKMGGYLLEKSIIKIEPTSKARPTDKDFVRDAMAKEYAVAIYDQRGNVAKVLYGGRIVNNDFVLVDRIQELVFGHGKYDDKPIGNVTIFLGDTRISTNVLDEHDRRAVGTRVSNEVYTKVVEEGQKWFDRAFVVTDWYKTAYEPIRNINGEIVGVLYVGLLEKPFVEVANRVLLIFAIITLAATILAVSLSLFLAGSISRPLTSLIEATRRLSQGYLGSEVAAHTGTVELDIVAQEFNEMSQQLHEREIALKVLNKNYLDLISFVSHELKGILSSTIMNAYSVKDGLLGMINFKQKKAMESIARNLDYLAATVKNFLDLSRIEKGEMRVSKVDASLKEDIIDNSVDAFKKQAESKQMEILNKADKGIKVKCDVTLMQVVVNNLIGNAVKYGHNKGRIVVSTKELNSTVQVAVYNDGNPISAEDQEKLFKKFSRLEREENRRVRGTGLGLFITKEIIDAHKGKIWVQPEVNGNTFAFQIEKNI